MNSIHIFTQLSDLPPSIEQFFETTSKGNVFFSHPWYRNFIEHILDNGDQLRAFAVGTAADSRDPAALLLMRAQTANGFGLRKLEPMVNYYTSLFGPNIDATGASVQQCCEQLAAAIANDRPRWDQINLNPMARDEPTFDAMKVALENVGFRTEPYFCFGNWYMKTQGKAFDEYFNGLPSQLRNTVNRKRKQLESTKRGRFEIVTSGEGLDVAIRAYEKIYNSSWKVPEPYPNFVRGLIKTCAERGWLRLGVGYVDGEPAAAQIWIVYQGIANIYKLAYDERFAKTSVGSILTTNLMRHVMDTDHVHEIDYLTGDDSYKKDWMSHRRERWGIMAYNSRTPRGLALSGANSLRKLAKRLMKRDKRTVENQVGSETNV